MQTICITTNFSSTDAGSITSDNPFFG